MSRDEKLSSRILDIGGSQQQLSFWSMLVSKLRPYPQQAVLPSALLSSDRGLQIWHAINKLPDYYQTDEEIKLLNFHGDAIVRQIPNGATLIDLGCGDVRKVRPLLDKLEKANKRVTYYGLDLSQKSLEHGIAQLSGLYRSVDCWGLWGTFDDALRWCRQIDSPKWFLSLGSILGNDFMDPAVMALSRWASELGPSDRILLGMDGTVDREKVWRSYHDTEGLFMMFMETGLAYSSSIMQHEWYRPEDWTKGGFWAEGPATMHRFVFTAQRDVPCPSLGLVFPRGTEIHCYEAFKYVPSQMAQQFHRAGLRELQRWNAPGSSIYEYLLSSSTPTGSISDFPGIATEGVKGTANGMEGISH